jgi:hypothetical protein
MPPPPNSVPNLNQRKRPKLNVYTPPNPSAPGPSVHKTYSFVSRSVGYQACSSRILSSEHCPPPPHSPEHEPLEHEPLAQRETLYEAGTTTDNFDPMDDVQVNKSSRKCTAGVSFLHH